MKFWSFLVITIIFIMLAGCSSGNQSYVTSTPLDIVQSPTEVADLPAPSPGDTPLPDPTATPIITEVNPTDVIPTSLPMDTPTPAPALIHCEGDLTSSNQAGPYYTQGSPERASLIEADMQGTPVLILGRVFDQDCNPVPGARVDLWLADVDGEYDNLGYRLRGHVFADNDGYYEIESIEPGIYTGRPPHIHVKVFAPDGSELLTTQMYFPGSENSGDVLSAPDLLVTYIESDETGRKRVIFNFVVLY